MSEIEHVPIIDPIDPDDVAKNDISQRVTPPPDLSRTSIDETKESDAERTIERQPERFDVLKAEKTIERQHEQFDVLKGADNSSSKIPIIVTSEKGNDLSVPLLKQDQNRSSSPSYLDIDDNAIIIAKIRDEKIRKKLEQLDMEGDGDIDAREVLRLKEIEQFYRTSTYLLAVAVLVLLGCIFAAAYEAVELGKESHVESGNKATSTAIRSRRLLATGPEYAPISDYSRSFNADLNGNPMVCNGLNPISLIWLLTSLQCHEGVLLQK